MTGSQINRLDMLIQDCDDFQTKNTEDYNGLRTLIDKFQNKIIRRNDHVRKNPPEEQY